MKTKKHLINSIGFEYIIKYGSLFLPLNKKNVKVNCDFLPRNSDFFSCNCEFTHHAVLRKKVRIVR